MTDNPEPTAKIENLTAEARALLLHYSTIDLRWHLEAFKKQPGLGSWSDWTQRRRLLAELLSHMAMAKGN